MKIFTKNFNKKAFSLIELSVVLVIISILIAGTLSVSVTSLNNAKAKSTRDKMAAIYQAMGAFLLKNGRLPCPASLVLAKTSASYGAEIGSAGTCSGSGTYTNTNATSGISSFGMVPTAALGLSTDMSEDAYGNKFSYVVIVKFTKSDGYPTVSTTNGFSFSTTAAGTTMMQIIEQPAANLTDSVMFAIISHGQNKFGAFNTTATTQNGASSDTAEATNYPTSISGNTASVGAVSGYSTRVTITSVSSSSDVFDDVVFFKTRENMLADFNAMFLLGCASTTSNGHSYAASYYGTLVQSSTANCTTPSNIRPSMRCSVGSSGGTYQAADTCSAY